MPAPGHRRALAPPKRTFSKNKGAPLHQSHSRNHPIALQTQRHRALHTPNDPGSVAKISPALAPSVAALRICPETMSASPGKLKKHRPPTPLHTLRAREKNEIIWKPIMSDAFLEIKRPEKPTLPSGSVELFSAHEIGKCKRMGGKYSLT